MKIPSLLFTLAKAGIAGAAVSLVLAQSLVAWKGPVFHWEMAGMVVTIIAGFVGGLAAVLASGLGALFAANGAKPVRLLIGAILGTTIGLSIGLLVSGGRSVNYPSAPVGLGFWSVVTLAAAGVAGGLVGGNMAQRRQT